MVKKFRRYLFVLAQLTNVTDGRTDTACRHTLDENTYRAYAYASRGKNCAAGMLNLTTGKHEASGGLYATAELLVIAARCYALARCVPSCGVRPSVCHVRELRQNE